MDFKNSKGDKERDSETCCWHGEGDWWSLSMISLELRIIPCNNLFPTIMLEEGSGMLMK